MRAEEGNGVRSVEAHTSSGAELVNGVAVPRVGAQGARWVVDGGKL